MSAFVPYFDVVSFVGILVDLALVEEVEFGQLTAQLVELGLGVAGDAQLFVEYAVVFDQSLVLEHLQLNTYINILNIVV